MSEQKTFDPAAALDPSRALVPAVVRVNSFVVRRGFWPKIRKLARRLPFAEDAVALWFCARDPATPTTTTTRRSTRGGPASPASRTARNNALRRASRRIARLPERPRRRGCRQKT